MSKTESCTHTVVFRNEVGDGKTTITAERPKDRTFLDFGDVKVRIERPQQEFQISLELTAREASRLIQALTVIGIE